MLTLQSFHRPTALQAAREFLVQYARWPHYAKTFAASGYACETARIATAYATGDLATAMSASRSRRDSA